MDELLECDCTLGYAVLYFIATFMVHDKLIVRVIVLLFKKKLITREEKVARLDEKKENEGKKIKSEKKKIWKWKCIKGFMRKGSK